MTAVIIASGRMVDYVYIKRYIKAGDFIICADGGYHHAIKMGLTPDVLVGDFDSIGTLPTHVKTIQYPTDKDYTDTELALAYARSQGFKSFLFLGVIGSRMDHSLGNILMLKDILAAQEKAMILDEHNKIILVDSQLQLQEPPGSTVSLIPLADCYGVTTHSLQYPLKDAFMAVGKSIGISNVTTQNHATITLTQGLLLVVVAQD